MVVVVPILLGVPPAFVRVIPRMMAAQHSRRSALRCSRALRGLRNSVLRGAKRRARISPQLSRCGVDTWSDLRRLAPDGASTQKNGVQCCAGECDFSVLCIQDFPPGACSPSHCAIGVGAYAGVAPTQSYTCARSPFDSQTCPLGCGG